MNSPADVSNLMKFVLRSEWSERLREALDDHLGTAMKEFVFEIEELDDILGDHWASVLWSCAFEDLATRRVGAGQQNLVDDYLASCGWAEPPSTRTYIRALRSSVMSLYEVGEVEAGAGFVVHDLIRGGEPIRVSEQSASETLQVGDRIAARLVMVNEQNLVAMGLLPFRPEAAEALRSALRVTNPTCFSLQDEESVAFHSRDLAPIISIAWLLDVIPALGPICDLRSQL